MIHLSPRWNSLRQLQLHIIFELGKDFCNNSRDGKSSLDPFYSFPQLAFNKPHLYRDLSNLNGLAFITFARCPCKLYQQQAFTITWLVKENKHSPNELASITFIGNCPCKLYQKAFTTSWLIEQMKQIKCLYFSHGPNANIRSLWTLSFWSHYFLPSYLREANIST